MAKGNFVRWITALVAVTAAAYLVAGLMLTREAPTPQAEDALEGTEGATSIISNFQHIESRLDRIGWELGASKAELLANKANLYGIRMRFYTPDQEVIALSGDSGSIDLATNNIVVRGNVEAAFNDTYRFFSEEVTWDAKTRVLASPGAVRIIGPEGEIKGTNMVARPNKKKFVIWSGVTVDLKGGIDNKGDKKPANPGETS